MVVVGMLVSGEVMIKGDDKMFRVCISMPSLEMRRQRKVHARLQGYKRDATRSAGYPEPISGQ